MVALDIATSSQADEIHLWGSEPSPRALTLIHDIEQRTGKRIQLHPWTKSKSRIYNSFDVLVSMSLNETFGLIVSEALSAGIPCLLSDIPAFRTFAGCSAVILTSPNDVSLAIGRLNRLMENRLELRAEAQQYWSNNFSMSTVRQQWYEAIDYSLARIDN